MSLVNETGLSQVTLISCCYISLFRSGTSLIETLYLSRRQYPKSVKMHGFQRNAKLEPLPRELNDSTQYFYRNTRDDRCYPILHFMSNTALRYINSIFNIAQKKKVLWRKNRGSWGKKYRLCVPNPVFWEAPAQPVLRSGRKLWFRFETILP